MIRAPVSFSLSEWRLTSDQFRLQGIQEYENALAASENREACKIDFFIEDGESENITQRGEYYSDKNTIKLNARLLRADTPHQAAETYLHEARHAYQNAVINEPSLHHDPEQVKDWSMNQLETNSYISPEEGGYPLYRSQPVEADANAVSRQRMDEIYTEQFTETKGYAEYRSGKELEAAEYIEQAEIVLGPDYEQAARQEVLERYAVNQQALAEETKEKQALDEEYDQSLSI